MKNSKSVEGQVQPLDNYTAGDLQEALRPIVSLISKSQKALQKLTPDTWQHTMLRDNLKALNYALVLMNNNSDTNNFKHDNLQEALRAFASMINKTEKAQVKILPGTSQDTLLRNRLKALFIASSLITKTLNC